MPSGFFWETTPTETMDELVAAYLLAIEEGVRELANAWSPIIEAYMKENAPWTDRTANARQTLNVRPEFEEHLTTIFLAHGMDYGIYLELAHAGVWAIINPTLDIFGPKVWDSVEQILS